MLQLLDLRLQFGDRLLEIKKTDGHQPDLLLAGISTG